jgi:activated CDC42 kinase 1
MKAKDNFKKDETKHQLFEIVKGDKIVIIEGNAANYWWSGQNQRTMRFGRFPRAILDPQRKLNSEDISMPLKNSFIHTGHMSAISKEKSWGELGKIDELFLRNPLTPPDLNTDDDDVNKKKYIFTIKQRVKVKKRIGES